jgi:hypothetical protein
LGSRRWIWGQVPIVANCGKSRPQGVRVYAIAAQAGARFPKRPADQTFTLDGRMANALLTRKPALPMGLLAWGHCRP